MQLFELSLTEAARLLKNKDISSVELTQSCVDRITDLDGTLKAFINFDADIALKAAHDADTRRMTGESGLLLGIPVAVKDLLCTKGIKTTCGSKILENYIPPYNATVVEKIQQEGGVIIGKLTMDEFAMGSTSETCAFGIPKNPWKTEYVAGGSSGGSAVAVAAGECFASLGSDTGGSIRQPASLCGVVGIKPTYGRVSRYGLVAFASSLDQVGPMARSVEDCALMLDVITGYDPKDSTSIQREGTAARTALVEGVKGIKIGVPKEYFVDGLDLEVRNTIEDAITVLRKEGAEIIEVSLPHTEYCVAAYYLIASAEASSNLARYDGVAYGYRNDTGENLAEMYQKTRSMGFGAEVKRRILIGTYALSSGYYDAYYKKASQVRTLILEDFNRVFTECDCLISPVVPTPAWPLSRGEEKPLSMYLSDILTISTNLCGIPGLSVPGGFSSAGLPIGVQLQGPHFSEELLVKVAYNLEKILAVPTLADGVV